MLSSQFLAWRKASGLTQVSAAAALGVSPKTVQRYEKGHAIPAAVAAAVMKLAPLAAPEAVDADPAITPATHPELYKRFRGGYNKKPTHPGYGKHPEHVTRVSDLATYTAPVIGPSLGDYIQSLVDKDIEPDWDDIRRHKAAKPAPVATPAKPEPLPPEWSGLPEAPDVCECGAALLPDGQCSFTFCPFSDDDPPED